MTVIVDASVAIKWVLEEEGSEAARRLAEDALLAAPELMLIECANVLRTKVRFGQLDPALSTASLAAIQAMPVRLIPMRPHVAAAHAIALEIDRSAYDCLYLAVTLAERATLVTADKRFTQAVAAHPVYRESVRPL